MKKPRIIFYDDEPEFFSQFQRLLEENTFEVITFDSFKELRAALKDPNTFKDVKALVFDLARNTSEAAQTRDFEILQDIREKFNQYRIPIFIHSAFAQEISDFSNCGTVWKIEKSGTSLENIVEIINNLNDSGFLEAFTPGGIIEQTFMQELHKSFTEQFREGEIEKIIKLLKQTNPENPRDRAISIFKRTAVKALMSELLSPVFTEGEKVSPIEHYYRRISKIDFWTGDILKKKNEDLYLLIITPRCNVASKKCEELLACIVEVGNFPQKIENREDRDRIGYALTDNPEISGYNRYLPPSPFFEGGKVILSKYRMVKKTDLLIYYDRVISLSDELTNEIIGKFGAYFFRTGITPWNSKEVIEQVRNTGS